MAERSSITQVIQLGVETTPGTAVAATKKMSAMDISTKVEDQTDIFRPQGFKYPTVTAQEKEWTTASMKGQPTYTEIVYPLSSVIIAPTVTQYMDGLTATGVYKWVFESSTTAPDTVKTYTIEQGSSVRAHKFANAVFTDFDYGISREKVEMSGKMLGQAIVDGITLTGSLSSLALVPITADTCSVFLDDTSGGLGTTKLGRLFDLKYALASRLGPFWVIDAALASYAGVVETVPKQTVKVIVESNAAGMALLDHMRADVTYFMRVIATGSALYSAGTFSGSPLTYRFQQDLAVRVVNTGDFSDQQGVYAIEFELEVVHDAGWGRAAHWEVDNQLSAL